MPHTWRLVTRGIDGRRTGVLRVATLSAVARWLGIGAGTAEVAYSWAALQLLVEGASVDVYRDGVLMDGMGGWLVSVTESMTGNIKIAWSSQQLILGDHVVVPDPTRDGDAQTTALQWSRTGVASTVMTALLAEQLGPAAHARWQVPGLTVAADPAVGGQVSAAIRYGSPNLLAELQTLSANSGADLGVSVTPDGAGGLTAAVRVPVDSTGTARFSADLRNLADYTFTRSAPTITDLIGAGKAPDIPTKTVTSTDSGGDTTTSTAPLYDDTTTPTGKDWQTLNTPQVVVSSTDPITTAWQRHVWSFKDLSSSVNDTTTLAQAAQQELPAGQATVALTCTLRDTDQLRFGRDWGLGHRVTVYVGRAKEPKTTVTDLVREVAVDYGPDGESITPAIGSTDANAIPTPAYRQALNRIAGRLAYLERSHTR